MQQFLPARGDVWSPRCSYSITAGNGAIFEKQALTNGRGHQIVDRVAPVPGSTPGMCCCAVTEGHGSLGTALAGPGVRRRNEPAPRSSERSAESPKGKKPQESWRSGDGSSHSFVLQNPEVLAGLDVKPPEGEGGGAAIKAGARSNESKLWRGKPHEGIDGRNHLWFWRQHGLVTGRRP